MRNNITSQERYNTIKKFYPEFEVTTHNSKELFHNVFKRACEDGNIDVVNHLLFLTKGGFRDFMIHTESNEAFLGAASNGHIQVLKVLLENTSNQQKKDEMLHARGDRAFAVLGDNLEAIKLLIEMTPDVQKRKKMIFAFGGTVFKGAIEFHNIQILKLLIEEVSKLNQSDNFLTNFYMDLIVLSANVDTLEVMKFILDSIPEASKNTQEFKNTIDGLLFSNSLNKNAKVLEFLFLQLDKDEIHKKAESLKEDVTEENLIEDLSINNLIDNVARTAIAKLELKLSYNDELDGLIKETNQFMQSSRNIFLDLKEKIGLPPEIVLNIIRNTVKNSENFSDAMILTVVAIIHDMNSKTIDKVNKTAIHNLFDSVYEILINLYKSTTETISYIGGNAQEPEIKEESTESKIKRYIQDKKNLAEKELLRKKDSSSKER